MHTAIYIHRSFITQLIALEVAMLYLLINLLKFRVWTVSVVIR